jgi:hypothetical protein
MFLGEGLPFTTRPVAVQQPLLDLLNKGFTSSSHPFHRAFDPVVHAKAFHHFWWRAFLFLEGSLKERVRRVASCRVVLVRASWIISTKGVACGHEKPLNL